MVKKAKWAHLQKNEKRLKLPSSGAEVLLREPDILTPIIAGEITLPDALFAMFAKATEDGEENPMQVMKEMQETGAGQGLVDFLNVFCKAVFADPKLVSTEEEADWETTVPVDAFNLIDKMFVMQEFTEVFQQLSGLQTFRPEANGSVQPASESN